MSPTRDDFSPELPPSNGRQAPETPGIPPQAVPGASATSQRAVESPRVDNSFLSDFFEEGEPDVHVHLDSVREPEKHDPFAADKATMMAFFQRDIPADLPDAVLANGTVIEQKSPASSVQVNAEELLSAWGETEALGHALSAEDMINALDTAPTKALRVEDMDIKPLQAGRSLQQAFPLNSPEEALALAAMPHYDLGGKAGIRMGQLELRHLLAEAEATLKGADQHIQEGSKRAIKESGEPVELATRKHTDIRRDADAAIKSLVEGGYIREIPLEPAEREKVRDINELLKADLPGDWKALAMDVNPVVAYELTDTGIEAGRSIRYWDGNSPEAGLVRLPDGAPMPPAVASDAYDLSGVVMETRALAKILKPGELGAFLKAELASIEYSHTKGTDPQVTAGRLDGVVALSKFAALNQLENAMMGNDASLRPADLAQITERCRALLCTLPEEVLEVSEDGERAYSTGIDKWGSYAEIAHLEGVRVGCEAINYRLSHQMSDMTDPKAWTGAVQIMEDRFQPNEQENTMAMADSIKVMRGWMRMVADKGESIRAEVMAFAEGSFGPKGHALAEHLLARA